MFRATNLNFQLLQNVQMFHFTLRLMQTVAMDTVTMDTVTMDTTESALCETAMEYLMAT